MTDASSPVGAAEISNLLVDLENVRGVFSGKLIDYRMPCTASEDRTCQIVSNLTVWNEFLCPLQLELRELSETGRQLSLVEINRWYRGHREGRLRQAATVLYWLLSIHHCVARIQIGQIIASGEMAELCVPVLCKTLEGNSSLKSVILDSDFYAEFQSEDIEKFSHVISSLKCPEKLEYPLYPILCPRSVSALLRSTTTLTALDWSSIKHLEGTLPQRFLAALRTNSTLRDLSLSVAVISADPALFLEFLSCHARLQNLRVIFNCDCCSDDSLRWILKGMLKNRSVSSLQAENVTLDFESVELATKMLAQNKVLRSFRLSPRISVLNESTAVLLLRMRRNTTEFQEAIARNNTLQYMALNFSIWSAEHWAPFFRVLSQHTSLKMVTIDVEEEEEEYRLLPGVVKALQESGSEEKVFFKAVGITDELAVADCKPFCEIRVELLELLTFINGLRPDIFKNYALCSVTGDYPNFSMNADWFAVRETSRRNSGFVARAAQFLNHARCDRHCAAGLDRVSRHPALVAELAEVLSIGQVEAADMVQRRFRHIQGLHEFMRLAGVVKGRVTCLPREDGRTQLDDLNDDCWAHVRRYLQLDDVPYSSASPSSP
ncbi:hypothetical protein HPB49_013138 [Dermacentor silvarum]|uniref:Uncharacterized protein n=1 Tax=Dermacentor silvarum TaxID=543639 RepID=A0ACB8CRM0_DERSI|nr:hypothetical protein HPB49_013138 [Dermacentor silvarum]